MSAEQVIIDQLATIISEKTEFDFPKLDQTMNLEQSGMDSFARINLVMEIEDHFGFELSDAETADMDTIGDLVRLIQVKTA